MILPLGLILEIAFSTRRGNSWLWDCWATANESRRAVGSTKSTLVYSWGEARQVRNCWCPRHHVLRFPDYTNVFHLPSRFLDCSHIFCPLWNRIYEKPCPIHKQTILNLSVSRNIGAMLTSIRNPKTEGQQVSELRVLSQISGNL